MRSQNDNQGLGFTLGGTVINRKFLTLSGFRLAGSFTTLYAILMAMGDDSAAGSSASGEGVRGGAASFGPDSGLSSRSAPKRLI